MMVQQQDSTDPTVCQCSEGTDGVAFVEPRKAHHQNGNTGAEGLPYPEKALERSVGLRLGYVARRMHGMRGSEEGKRDDSVLATQAR